MSVDAASTVGSETRVSKEQRLAWYELMWLIRTFDERGLELFAEGLVRGSLHAYIGMEAGAVGACSALAEQDFVGTYHRGHGHCLARGLDPNLMMAEVLGRRDGYCRGKGGTMHIASFRHGVLGADGVVGGLLPVAVGAAYASKLRGESRVAMAFFGEGTINQGVFHEALNIAKVLNVPVVFVCENNQWALNTRSATVTAGDVLSRAAAYAIPAWTVDGPDVESVHQAALEAVELARRGDGPALVEIRTYRWASHSAYAAADPRPDEERAHWRERDPILLLGSRLRKQDKASENELDERRESAIRRVEEAVVFAKESPPPDSAWAFEDVYADSPQGAR